MFDYVTIYEGAYIQVVFNVCIACMRSCPSNFTYACTFIYTHALLHMHVHVYRNTKNLHTLTSDTHIAPMVGLMYVCMYVCIYIYVYVCMYVCTH